MQLDNATYDRLKFFVTIFMPALTAFYLGLGQVLGWHDTDKVGACLGLFTVFVGAILRGSSKKYQKKVEAKKPPVVGELGVTGPDPDTGIPNVQVKFHGLPDELADGYDEVRLKVGSIAKIHREPVAEGPIEGE